MHPNLFFLTEELEKTLKIYLVLQKTLKYCIFKCDVYEVFFFFFCT